MPLVTNRILLLLILTASIWSISSIDIKTDYNGRFKGFLEEHPEISHSYENRKIGKYLIAIHKFTHRNPIGTVVLTHGYYDHTGILINIIRFLTQNNYTVITYDQPGHGFSTGPRASIDNFREYSFTLTQITNSIKDDISPHYLIGHSTGGSAIIDGLLNNKLEEYSKIILVAPLVRSNYWFLSKFGNSILDNFTKKIPRKFRKNSSDNEYLNFVKHIDELQYKELPLKWFNSLSKWNDEIENKPSKDIDLLIIQGDRDSTVDWNYNLNFLKKKFPRSSVVIIEDGEHQLYNEKTRLRDLTFYEIANYISTQELE